MDIVERFKVIREGFKLDIPIDPRTISGISVFLSFGIVYWPTLTVAIVLVLDAIDGAIARAKGLTSKEGELLDWTCDRYSEFIIFGFLAMKWPLLLLLPIINTAITLEVVKKSKGFYILPLRHLLLVYLLLVSFMG